MEQQINTISLVNLSFAFIPVAVVMFVLYQWSLPTKKTFQAILRMLIQLLIVGYCLGFIFESNNAWLVGLILTLMILFSSWIAINNVAAPRWLLIKSAIISIAMSGIFTLFIITQGVLELTPWYQAQTLLPLAGMIFASSMNSISLAGERFFSEQSTHQDYQTCRNIAFQASMIPNINALLAVGIVSLPGMMTGQILSGVSPLIAARYQIMVMCMVFAAGGLASACFLVLIKQIKLKKINSEN